MKQRQSMWAMQNKESDVLCHVIHLPN